MMFFPTCMLREKADMKAGEAAAYDTRVYIKAGTQSDTERLPLRI